MNGENRRIETIKRLLSNRPVLAIYDPKAHTEVHTDACVSGIVC